MLDYAWCSKLVSEPTKLRGTAGAFSLPAKFTCLAGKKSVEDFGADAKCSHCYACHGRYNFTSVKEAQLRQLGHIKHLLEGNIYRAVCTMIVAVRSSRDTKQTSLFRIHSSGDFFSLDYINLWYDVARLMPDITFWATTTEWYKADKVKMSALNRFSKLSNVVLRPSAVKLNEPSPNFKGWAAGTAVFTEMPLENHYVCPATTDKSGEHKTCKAWRCTVCWHEFSEKVAYKMH